MFETLLIANRGEIACRVLRTARRLGVLGVAVYSEADAEAPHVREADLALPIGAAPAADSYLCGDRILAAAKRAGADAIHPGYGFLSESPDFAAACAAAGVTFVGPPPEAIRAMGLKDAAKLKMEAAGVPVVPGHHGEARDDDTLRRAAEEIGYPVLVKAVAGGGGKGMRRVDRAGELDAALASARREAEAAFGDPSVLIEKCIERPRHIEVQVFADRQGGALHLFERDCSIQRRHQKVIEEAPAPGLPGEMREVMGEAAVRAARAIGYEGAGTVEFIVDVAGGLAGAPFYFMEMNTRLQVEHPVTEAVTGLDLVEWQLRVAAGEPLPLEQQAVTLAGHAVEARLYAEDPARSYLPQTGRLVRLRPPAESAHVRVDTGVVEGDEVGIHYDPMIAKLIVHDRDRESALRRLRRALEQYEVAGLVTNLPLLQAVADHPAFVAGEIDTGFLERHEAELLARAAGGGVGEAIALACAGLLASRASAETPEPGEDPFSPWARTDAFRLNEDGFDVLHLRCEGEDWLVTAHFRERGHSLEWDGGQAELGDVRIEGNRLSVTLDGVRRQASYLEDGDAVHLVTAGRSTRLERVVETGAVDEDSAGGGVIRSPMPGRIVAVLVEEGEAVERGQALIRLEAMKMEHTLHAACDGTVERLSARVDDQVEEGITLLVVT